MTNFTIIPPMDYEGELLRRVPRFALSAQYRALRDEDRKYPGLVFAAFARFMETSIADNAAVEECRQAIEWFASKDDPEAHNYIITEVFETFRQPEISRELLLPQSRALYDRWIGV
jgi:hypothetical protein